MIKRRFDVLCILPNARAVIRLARAILMKRSGEWAIQCRFMALESLAAVGDDRKRMPAIAVG